MLACLFSQIITAGRGYNSLSRDDVTVNVYGSTLRVNTTSTERMLEAGVAILR
jgi:hypothetical protein